MGWSKTGHEPVALDVSQSYAQDSRTHAYSQDKLTEPNSYAVANILLLGQAPICWQQYNPVLLHTEIHDRSIFPFLQSFISFELSLSPPRSTKFYAGSKQALLCVIINIPHHPVVKINNPAYYALGKYWMQARGLQLKFCCLEAICCSLYTNQTNLIVKSSTKLGGSKQGSS